MDSAKAIVLKPGVVWGKLFPYLFSLKLYLVCWLWKLEYLKWCFRVAYIYASWQTLAYKLFALKSNKSDNWVQWKPVNPIIRTLNAVCLLKISNHGGRGAIEHVCMYYYVSSMYYYVIPNALSITRGGPYDSKMLTASMNRLGIWIGLHCSPH